MLARHGAVDAIASGDGLDGFVIELEFRVEIGLIGRIWEAGVFVLLGDGGQGDGVGDDLVERIVRDVGAGDDGLATVDNDAEAHGARGGLLDGLQLLQAHRDGGVT